MVSANCSTGGLVAVAATSRCGFTIDPGRCQIYMASATQNLQLLAIPQALIGACEMTTHDKDKVISAAKEADLYLYPQWLHGAKIRNAERFYAIAFEAGRQAEREECAKEAEYYIKHSTVAKNIAEDIRARSTE